jgi:hypothetical protein
MASAAPPDRAPRGLSVRSLWDGRRPDGLRSGPVVGAGVHERWDYDDATGVQALRRLLALCRGCHASTHYGLAEVQGRDGEAFAIGIILVVIGVILAILAAPAPAIAGRRHFF